MSTEAKSLPGFPALAIRTAVAHTVTYFIMGLLASNLLNYRRLFAIPEFACYMRPLDDPILALGPVLQPLRGLIFALVFSPLRESFFGRPRGWLILWWTLVGIGILSPFGTGGVEALIYTQVPIPEQLLGMLEVIPQALLLSLLLTHWVQHPEQGWLNWALGILFAGVIALPLLGFVMLALQ